jgi:nucleoid-associated protein YgaU
MTALLTPDRHRSRSTSIPFPRPVALDQDRALWVAVRPSLVVIEGGRAPAALAERRTYMLRRLVVGAALAAIIGTLLWGLVSLGAPPTATPLGTAPKVTSTRYVVRPGDSLWGIATALHRDGDVRDVVDRLAQVNGSDTVFAGEAITIPSDLLH